jgi:hypothetical protein
MALSLAFPEKRRVFVKVPKVIRQIAAVEFAVEPVEERCRTLFLNRF